jgi:hypothetical protein
VDKAHKQGTRRAHSAAPAVPEEGRVFTLDDLEPLDEPSEVSGHRAPAPLLPADPSSDQVARALDEADRLRKLGQLEEAAAFLRDAVQGASPGDPRRALAALSYARLSTDACETAALLALTIDEMPAGLREPSLGRLVTALEACGQAERARAVAETYLLEFPEGPSSARMKGIAAP